MLKFLVGRIYHAISLAFVMLAVFGVYAVARAVVWFCGDWTDAISSLVIAWLLVVIFSVVVGGAAALKK